MRTNMHYYSTYAMARTTRSRDNITRAIATATEYVDDSDRLDPSKSQCNCICPGGTRPNKEAR